ncbi:MAG: hypothetical protein WCC04_20535 [Terriglobales bacterium]
MKAFRVFGTQYLPFAWVRATALGLLCAIYLSFCPSKTAWSQDSVQRDPQALTILAQTITAGGGQELLASIQDLTETGTITYNWVDPVTGDVTVKSRGIRQLRVDVDLPKGRRTTVVNGNGGSLKETNGRARPIYRQSTNDLGSLTLPILPLIAAIQDSATSIIYHGLVTHHGTQLYDVRVPRVYTKQRHPTRSRGITEIRDYYIDSRTFLLTVVSDRVYFGGPRHPAVTREYSYSHYQPVHGIMAPLKIVETVQGVTGFTMTFNQVAFNSGLSDSDFKW